MTNCDFGINGVCSRCGYRARKRRTYRECPEATDDGDTAGTIAIASSYAAAVSRWLAAGMPTRSTEEVEEILQVHCGPCEHYTGSACNICGCRVNASARAWSNKLAMATESCPADPPRWTAAK